jgi:hypothetical protein
VFNVVYSKKVKKMVPVSELFTVKKLQAVAKTANILGVSKLRKAELESTIMSLQHGRKEVWQMMDKEWAKAEIEKLKTLGTFFLPKPVPKYADDYISDREYNQIFKENSKAKASYVGKLKALKQEVYDNNLPIRWMENETGIRFAVVKQAA